MKSTQGSGVSECFFTNTQTQSIDTNTVAESVSVSSSSWLAAATGHSDKFRLLVPPAHLQQYSQEEDLSRTV